MTSMRGLTIGLTVAFFVIAGAVFWYLAQERGALLWLLFGIGAYSLGRWYQYDHASGPPWGDQSPRAGA